MDRYNARMSVLGLSRKEREINKKKDYVLRNKETNPSLKKVKIDGVERYIYVNTSTKPYYKEIQSLPNEMFYSGQIVEWEDYNWLITESDADNDVYVDGTMDQCNWKLKWQNDKLDVIECWVRIGNASAYNTGVKGDAVVEIGYDQMKIYMPYNNETKKLRRGMRMFIDNNKSYPTPYQLTRIDTVTDVYGDHGVISAIFSESQLNDNDNVELFLCDYKEKKKNEVNTSRIVSNSNYLVVEYKKGTTYIAEFLLNDEELDESVTPIWDIVCDFKDKLFIEEKDNSITISTNNVSLIGRFFTIKLSCNKVEYDETSMVVEVVGIN